MAKPTFLFVPGIWHQPSVFSPVTTRLSSHGYPTTWLSLPSVGANPGLPDFSADVDALTKLINTHLSKEEDLILVFWSYGSVPGSEAVLPSMIKSAREKEGLRGGVIHLVYLAAPILPVGMSVAKSRPPEVEESNDMVTYNDPPGTVVVGAALAAMLFYNDVEDPAVVKELTDGLQPMSLGPLRSELTRAAWMYTPSTVVMCEKDLGLPTERFEKQLEVAREIKPGAFERVEKCGASHVPFVTMPEWVVEVLRRAAGEEV